MRERACQALVHTPECECQGCRKSNCNGCRNSTKDHFTPQSIGRKILGWKPKQINSKENIQFLSVSCHREKDYTTSDRLQALYNQRRGGEITLDDVRSWAGQSSYNSRKR
jgi:hypothetical protein